MINAAQFAQILGVRISKSLTSNRNSQMDSLDLSKIRSKGFARILKGETKERIIFHHSSSAWAVRNRGLFVKVTESDT